MITLHWQYSCDIKQMLLNPEIFGNTNVHFVWFCCSMPQITEEAIAKQNLNSFEVLKEASVKLGAFSLPTKRPLIYSGDAKSNL
jgi:hypothetical protein